MGEDKPTLQEGELDILAIHGHSTTMLQLHKTVGQAWQTNSGRAGADSIGVISTLPREEHEAPSVHTHPSPKLIPPRPQTQTACGLVSEINIIGTENSRNLHYPTLLPLENPVASAPTHHLPGRKMAQFSSTNF